MLCMSAHTLSQTDKYTQTNYKQKNKKKKKSKNNNNNNNNNSNNNNNKTKTKKTTTIVTTTKTGKKNNAYDRTCSGRHSQRRSTQQFSGIPRHLLKKL